MTITDNAIQQLSDGYGVRIVILPRYEGADRLASDLKSKFDCTVFDATIKKTDQEWTLLDQECVQSRKLQSVIVVLAYNLDDVHMKVRGQARAVIDLNSNHHCPF